MEALTLAAVGLLVAAAITDGRSRRIPNPLPLGLALLGLARIASGLAGGAGIAMAALDLAAAAAVFLAGAVAFRFRLLGGGDVKLIAAAALWLGAAALGPFLLATALAGGALAVGFLLLRLLGRGGVAAGLPYGIAIAAGGIFVSAGAAWA
jgi:prepilin peptidase CpaA